MKDNKSQLAEFLSAAIHGQKIQANTITYMEWDKLLSKAESHNVKALLYSAFTNLANNKYLDDEILSEWKKDTALTAILQMKHIEQVKIILRKFNESHIPVILLKGLVTREFYPRPELRSMSDSDILVYKEDLERVSTLLSELGYYEAELTPCHIAYAHEKYLPVEVHWTLADERYIDDISDFESHMWQNAVEVKLGDVSALSLSDEDLLFHLCLHIAVHAVSSGFGLRQLCDIVLLVNQKGNMIDWKYFQERLKANGIEKFTIIIFMICKELFQMEVPKQLYNEKIIKQKYFNIFIEGIYSGGVFGEGGLENAFGTMLSVGSVRDKSNSSRSIIKDFIRILFPSPDELTDKYGYAKRHKVLVPLAGIHHIISGLLSKQYKLSQKIKFFIFAVPIAKRKTKLIKWLEL